MLVEELVNPGRIKIKYIQNRARAKGRAIVFIEFGWRTERYGQGPYRGLSIAARRPKDVFPKRTRAKSDSLT